MVSSGIKIKDVALIGICSAIIIALQVSLSAIPNIELVSLLIILYTQNFGKKTLYIIYIFAIAMGLIWGFTIWWLTYLYVWTVLYFIVCVIGKLDSAVGWALVSAIFGLIFGTLCVVPTLITLGPAGALSWVVSGFVFDLLHCGGNFLVAMLLWRPLSSLFKKIKAQFGF